MFEALIAFTRSVMVTPVALQQRQVGHYGKLRHLPALDEHGAHAVHAVQRRLQVVGSNLPELGLRNRVGGETIAKNGKGGEGEPVGGDVGRGAAKSCCTWASAEFTNCSD